MENLKPLDNVSENKPSITKPLDLDPVNETAIKTDETVTENICSEMNEIVVENDQTVLYNENSGKSPENQENLNAKFDEHIQNEIDAKKDQ